MRCRHCHAPLALTFVDLGTAPPSNAYRGSETLHVPETRFPLRVLVCEQCWLVQTEDYVGAGTLFTEDYAYFSSYSETWLEHSARYTRMAQTRFGLGPESLVIEVAANDGYLLQYFRGEGIRCLGIEPTAATAAAARARGLEMVQAFFGARLAHTLVASVGPADLMVANNVLAHVPDINDFLEGFRILLKPQGIATFEFPHLLRLRADHQFDTIYHEHYSYLSLTSVMTILAARGLEVWDVEEWPTHGGSLRIFVQPMKTGIHPSSGRVRALAQAEREAGMAGRAFYQGFQGAVDRIRDQFRAFLVTVQQSGRRIGAYGAAAKGNTLLNYAAVDTSLIPYVVDRNPAKQGRFLPGSRIPIVPESRLAEDRPDLVLILPWNLKTEVMAQLAYVREWGGRFVTAVPRVEVS